MCSDIDEDIDVVASDQDDLMLKDYSILLDRSSRSTDNPDSPHSLGGNQSSIEDDQLSLVSATTTTTTTIAAAAAAAAAAANASTSGAWQGFMQQWPTQFSQLGVAMDPRILGRYYGQYMAAAQQHASRRINLTNAEEHIQHNNSNSNTTVAATSAAAAASLTDESTNEC